MSAQVAADLRAAAEVLRRDGWTQHRYHRLIGGRVCHCAEGAIAVATGAHRDIVRDESLIGGVDYDLAPFDDHVTVRRDQAEETLRRHVGADPLRGVPQWNDAESRTADEVIAALEAAADAAEAQP